MKWLTAGVVMLVVATVGAGWYGFQTINDLREEMTTLTNEVETASSNMARSIEDQQTVNGHLFEQLQAENPDVSKALRETDTLRSDLDDMQQQMDRLYDTLATLVLTPPPADTVVVEVPTAPEGPTTQWCAQYLLALETAGLNRAQAQGSSNMNFAEYHDWVVLPMVEIGCPDPNE